MNMPGRIPPATADAPVSSRGRRPWLAVVVIVTVVVCGALFGRYRASIAATTAPQARAAITDTSARAPSGARVTVRVLNTTSTRGLARRATLALRAYGYDVVDYDSDTKRRGKGTVVLVHTGKNEVAQRLQRALGTGGIETASTDGSRYVDFTVLLGSDWKAPSQPFRP